MTKRKWEDIETGRRQKLASFISANNASSSFGTFVSLLVYKFGKTYTDVKISFLLPN